MLFSTWQASLQSNNSNAGDKYFEFICLQEYFGFIFDQGR